MARKALLSCGAAASALYLAMNLFVPLQWPAYSSFSQTISELSAIDAPTRPTWVPLGIAYTLLVAAFGAGVWQAAGGNRRLRLAGALFVASGLIGLGWLPMHQRHVLAAGGATLTDTMHIAWSAITVVLMLMQAAFAAGAAGRRFRAFTAATMLVLLVFGVLTFRGAPGVAANLPTPWLGVWERINVLGFMVWQAALAGVLLRAETRSRGREAGTTDPAFKSARGAAAYLAAYDAAMKAWPIPYEELDVPTRFGTTHVVVSGPVDAPPLVLLHGYWATLTMWAAHAGEFGADHRVYAVDVMGQPGRSTPAAPIRTPHDYVAWLTGTLDALRLERVPLVGMSFGGWLALEYAASAPARVSKLVLLSPGGILPMVRQFTWRGMLMVLFPARFTVNGFLRWLGFRPEDGSLHELVYLGLRHFRIPLATARIGAVALSDAALRSLCMPTLLLYGEHEVICDPAAALGRARRLVPFVEGVLLPQSGHDMVVRQRAAVDARVRGFLARGAVNTATDRIVA